MKKGNQQKTSSQKDPLKDVSGGYVRGIGKDTLGVFDNSTKELVTSAKFSGDLATDRELFKALTDVDIDHNKKG